MKRLVKRMAALGFAAVFLWVAPAQAQFFVDCDAGDSIQDALDAQEWLPSADVEFTGTCEELVTVRHDRASIVGIDGATLIGRIRVFGPSNVALRDFTVTGENDGLTIAGGRARIRNVNINGNEGVGITGVDGATIRLTDCWVADNQAAHGVVLNHSTLRMANTHILGHPDLGIAAFDNSTVISNGGSVGDNHRGIFLSNGSTLNLDGTHVTDNVIDGVLMATGSNAVLVGPVLTRNGGHGIDVGLNSSADISEGLITDNGESGVYVTSHSIVRLTGTEVSGNVMHGISLINDAGAEVWDFTTVPENQSGWAVYCNGKEAGLDVSDLATVGLMKCPDRKF